MKYIENFINKHKRIKYKCKFQMVWYDLSYGQIRIQSLLEVDQIFSQGIGYGQSLPRSATLIIIRK